MRPSLDSGNMSLVIPQLRRQVRLPPISPNPKSLYGRAHLRRERDKHAQAQAEFAGGVLTLEASAAVGVEAVFTRAIKGERAEGEGLGAVEADLHRSNNPFCSIAGSSCVGAGLPSLRVIWSARF